MTEHLFHGAEEGIRTPDPLITNQLLWTTELLRHFPFFRLGLQRYVFPLFLPNFFERILLFF